MNTQYQICFYSGSLAGKIFPIVKEETKIGRDASCDIVLTENSVSRIHVCLYVQQNGSVVLVDNNSMNGTAVNSYQISAPVQLSENDVISLGGDVMLVFQKAAGFDPGSQWNSTDMPAGNAPDSYNFEKKQGNPMSNENNNIPNDGAMNGFAPNNGANQQQGAENFGFNQAYNMGYGAPGMNQGQMPYGFNQPNPMGQYDMNAMNNQPPMQMPQSVDNNSSAGQDNADANSSIGGISTEAVIEQVKNAPPIDKGAQQMPNDPYAQPPMGQQMPYGAPYSQVPMYGQQNPYGNNPYAQQPMGQQMPFGADPYSQQPMGQPQNNFGADPYSQQPAGQPQNAFGADPYSQQPMGQQMPFGGNPYGQPMGQQMPYGNDPYGQQMGQQMPYGSDPYGQQMGQQMPYGNDPYGQQMGQQMPYGNNPYGQPMGQQMPYGSDPYGQPMGQQMPYGNNPYAQQPMGQQMPYGNNPYAQQPMGQFPGAQGAAEEPEQKKDKKKLFIILGIILFVLILIAAFIFYVDHNRLWCDVFPFLWDADTCANYVR